MFAGRYIIRGELGRGMMGVVYEAEDTVLGRTVAVKTIELAFGVSPGQRDEFERRFFTEARVAAKLSHPGIVVCHDVGKDPDSAKLFIVFEHLKGHTLAERLAVGPMTWRDGLQVVAKVARAIHHAHEHGVIHRDLKPANVMLLGPSGPGTRPAGDDTAIKIMDFGVARVESVGLRLTAAGQSFGSPLYMSPEQALGHASDARSDIFSLGSILCTALLGRPWFEAPNITKILARVIHEDAPALSTLVPGVPAALDRVVARTMAKRMDDRYPSAAAMADDLEDILAGREPRHTNTYWTATSGPLGVGGDTTDADALLAELTGPVDVDPAGVRTGTVNISSLIDDTPPTAVRSRPARRWLWLLAAIAIVSTLAILGAFAVFRPPPLAEVESVASSTESAPTALFTPAEVVTPSPTPDLSTPSPEPTAAPRTEPRRVEPAVVATVAPTPEPPRTRLRLDVQHPLENGRLIVWLDGVLMFETRLKAEATKRIVAIKVHEGRVEKMLDVAPGRHEVRVEIAWDGKRRTDSKVVDVAKDTTGLLEVRLARVTNDLAMEWTPLVP